MGCLPLLVSFDDCDCFFPFDSEEGIALLFVTRSEINKMLLALYNIDGRLQRICLSYHVYL